MANSRGTRLWQQWWPFALLCLAASSQWLITANYPQTGSTLASNTVACALAALLSLGIALTKHPALPTHSPALTAALGGTLLLTGPSAALLLQASVLDPASLVLALALTPVVVAVAEPAFTACEFSTASLWPGLATVTGLLLILPTPSLASPRNDAALLLAPVLTGAGCVLFRRSASSLPPSWSAAAAFTGTSLVFGFAATAQSTQQHVFPHLSFPAVGMNAVLLLLAILAQQRLSPLQYTARYALVPCAVLLQGILLLHATATGRSIACAVLLAGATVWLLRARVEKQESEFEDSGLRR